MFVTSNKPSSNITNTFSDSLNKNININNSLKPKPEQNRSKNTLFI